MRLCRAEEEAEYGARVEMNQTAVETLKMFHSQHDLDTFLASSQVSTVLYCTVLYCTAGQLLAQPRLRVQSAECVGVPAAGASPRPRHRQARAARQRGRY